MSFKLEHIAKELVKKEDNVMFATFDWIQNDFEHPKVSLKSLPEMYFFPGNDAKTPVKYDGEHYEVGGHRDQT
jgi:hypothetical protein